MKFKPYDRLINSKEMLKKCDLNEATFRSVMHQSYYAAFNQLSSEIENRLFYPVDEIVKKASVHKAYIDACELKQDTLNKLNNDFDILDSLINDIKRLRGLRRKSDYFMDIVVVKSEADLAIELSDRIFTNIEKLT